MKSIDLYENILDSQSKNSLDLWKIEGKTKLTYDLQSKAYLLTLSQASLSYPQQMSAKSVIFRPILLIQGYFFPNFPLCIELALTDLENNKKRVIFGKNPKVFKTKSSLRVPSSLIFKGTWLNLCIDFNSIFDTCFSGSDFWALNSILISGSGHLRKVTSFVGPPSEYLSKILEITSFSFAYQEINRNIVLNSIAFSNSPARIKDPSFSPQILGIKKLPKYLNTNFFQRKSTKESVFESKNTIQSPALVPIKKSKNCIHSSSLVNNKIHMKIEQGPNFRSIKDFHEISEKDSKFQNFFQCQSSKICHVRHLTPPFEDYNPIQKEYVKKLIIK